MTSLIQQVREERDAKAINVEKAKIKLMLELIDSKEEYFEYLKNEIDFLKLQLKHKNYEAVEVTKADRDFIKDWSRTSTHPNIKVIW